MEIQACLDHELPGGLRTAHTRSGHHGVQATSTLAPDDAVVALLAPSRAPTVPDNPIFLAILLTETNNRNTMVNALGIAENLPRVGDAPEVELHGPSVNANGERPILHKSCSN